MKISTSIDCLRGYGDLKSVLSLLKASGFDCYDYTMEGIWGKPLDVVLQDGSLEKAKEIRALADSVGIECNQTHAPFPSFIVGDDAYNEKMSVALRRAVEVSGILGAKNCAVHPAVNVGSGANIVFFKRLEDISRKTGVRIALENLYGCDLDGNIVSCNVSTANGLKECLAGLSEDCFGICLDVGHAEVVGESAAEMIRELKDKMIAIHLHDVDLVHDNHALPFTEKVDFAPIIQALRDIDYKGDVTLEVVLPKGMQKQFVPVFVKRMAETAYYFRNQIME